MNDKAVMEDVFYAKPFNFSYSSLNKLLYSPALFYKHYILGERDEDDRMIEGTLVHCLLLENTKFNTKFVIAQSNVPSDNVKDIIDKVYQIYKTSLVDDDLIVRGTLSDYEDDIISLMNEKAFYMDIKDKAKRLAKVINEKGNDYFTFLIDAENKILIDEAMYSKCVDTVELIKNHPCYRDYLGLDGRTDRVTVTEVKLELKDEYSPFGLKGIVDNVSVDEAAKIIYINDIKTTSKSISEFEDTVEYYKYSIQAAIYERLVRHELKTDETWKCIFTFIVVDKYSQVYPFEVSEDTMTRWQIDLQDVLKIADYHYTQREYGLPYKFCKQKVCL